jgi:long-chain acyl-CoA synthetase
VLENRVAPAKNLSTVRQMVDAFPAAWLGLPALKMKRGDSYWTLTYGELQEHTRSLGNALLAMGAGPGTRVGLISENRSEWVVTYLAAASAGAVIVPYDILLKSDELASIMRASEAKIIFTSAEYLEKVMKAAAAAGMKGTLVLFDAGAQAAGSGAAAAASPAGLAFDSFASLLEKGRALCASGQDRYAAAKIAPDDLAALIFTSGTTGVPKGVMLSHRNLVENGDGVQQSTELGPGDNWIIVLPFHHTYPTSMGIFTPLLTGGMITPVPSMKTNVLISTMKETGATCIPAIPLLIEKIYKGILTNVKAKPPAVRVLFRVMLAVSKFFFKVFGIQLGKILFKSVARELGVLKLRFFISGGGPIAKEIIDGMDALGLSTYQGYGLSETSPVISATCPAHNKPGSVGLPLVNVQVRIDNPDENGNGEIVVRGPCVMLGYLGMPEKTREVLEADGWMHTGDLGRQDADGYLFITGRLKNIIVTKGGKNIYPEEIENLLLQSPLIAECVVIGKLDKEGGEYPHAIIYPNPDAMKAMEAEAGKSFTDEEIRKIIRAEIQKSTAGSAVYKIPQGFEVSKEELPKTSSSKVKRFLFAEAKR